ncbi:ABC transporter ATP-binding protein [Conexibacter woesei]|uniref:ABC transporter related protein n=1 Tax=Conexibacter woesei (strain DSM 14684 / CCUG 47730 / CIP 108061 / JCM 11494 / NBRC 100937 / ID131577) TaxID=469383 RepID=D3FDM9_CONWI|nr:ATP-binding cassette domain-containing protein [Conexibacter woesei]ADB49603.1 ABC transporter related protein [Conexibacter woesei DSM 14684]
METDGEPLAAGLSARGLRLARGAREVLRDVSFDAPKGQVTVVVAPSGAGKSTLLRCCNGLLALDAGVLLLDGGDVAASDACALRRRVGLVGQLPVMLPGTVRDNLAYALAADDPRAAEPALLRALDAAGLDGTFLARPAGELSGGERARVALARALTRGPELLLLDEPTAALDAAAAAHVGETLTRLAHDGLGVVVATHDLVLAARIADRAVALRDGRAVEGAPAEILAAAGAGATGATAGAAAAAGAAGDAGEAGAAGATGPAAEAAP